MKSKCVLPCTSRLIKEGLETLYRYKIKYPEKFAHIKQDSKHKLSLEESIKLAENLEKKYGKIKGCNWLLKNGYNSLYSYMNRYPKSFSHIQHVQKEGNTLDEWIKISEKLAKKNNGLLPSSSWLKNNGYYGLPQCIRKNPEKFNHIKQEYKGGKKVDEWVKVAEKLAKENNGILPYSLWLKNNGYYGLSQMILRFPEKFNHISKDKKGRSIDEWVDEAKRIEKEKGELPSQKWLQKNGYGGLARCISANPSKFKCVKQKRFFKSIEEWVKIAEKLEKEHGELPNFKYLNKNGYKELVRYIYRHPDNFSHIKRNKLINNIKEWINISKELLLKNNNILPSMKFLRKNGHSGLCYILRKHPDKFKGIKQEYRDGVRIIGKE